MTSSAFHNSSKMSGSSASQTNSIKYDLRQFERDIEDAVFETIEKDQDQFQARRGHFAGADFGKRDQKPIAFDPHIFTLSQDNSELNRKESFGLDVFSGKSIRRGHKSFVSQICMAISVAVFTMALVLPLVWWISGDEPVVAYIPDPSIQTGSVIRDNNPVSGEEIFGSSAMPQDLTKPKLSRYATSAAKEIDGSAGSILYIKTR